MWLSSGLLAVNEHHWRYNELDQFTLTDDQSEITARPSGRDDVRSTLKDVMNRAPFVKDAT